MQKKMLCQSENKQKISNKKSINWSFSLISHYEQEMSIDSLYQGLSMPDGG
jgi:hypothetical protein